MSPIRRLVLAPCTAGDSLFGATLIDTQNRAVQMPTDFDDFTPAAMWHYRGADPAIRSHVHLLQVAMRDADFYGQPQEWWHFVIADIKSTANW